jgi:hypothetical protein
MKKNDEEGMEDMEWDNSEWTIQTDEGFPILQPEKPKGFLPMK